MGSTSSQCCCSEDGKEEPAGLPNLEAVPPSARIYAIPEAETAELDVDPWLGVAIAQDDGPLEAKVTAGASGGSVTEHDFPRQFSKEEAMRMRNIRTSQMLTKCEPYAPGLLRAVEVRHCLRGLGRVLHPKTEGNSQQSFCVEDINDFWSHSWHARAWHKICMLYLYYNGAWGVAAGCLTAVLVAAALPGDWDVNPFVPGIITLFTAEAVCVAVTLWWPARQRVFLDKVCITQDDEEVKRQAILSLGYFLRSSRNMLVLWDASYFTRLWCVYEFAVRLKLSQDGSGTGAFSMRPCLYGVVVFVIHACAFVFQLLRQVSHVLSGAEPNAFLESSMPALLTKQLMTCIPGFLGLTLAAYLLQESTMSFSRQQKDLDEFSIENAQCFCCTVDHRHPQTGENMRCDRQMIKQAVVQWFGSTDQFDSYVRSNMQLHVEKYMLLSYRYAFLAGIAPFWATVGTAGWCMKNDLQSDCVMYMCTSLFEIIFHSPLVLIWFCRSLRMVQKLQPAQQKVTRVTKLCVAAKSAGLTLMLVTPVGFCRDLGFYKARQWWGYVLVALLYLLIFAIGYKKSLKRFVRAQLRL